MTIDLPPERFATLLRLAGDLVVATADTVSVQTDRSAPLAITIPDGVDLAEFAGVTLVLAHALARTLATRIDGHPTVAKVVDLCVEAMLRDSE